MKTARWHRLDNVHPPKKVFLVWRWLTANRTLIMFSIFVGSIVIVLVSLLLLSINWSQVIRRQWNDLSADFIKLNQTGNAVDNPAWFSRLANHDLIALRIVNNTLMASTATQLFDPSDADHQLYQFIETPAHYPICFFTKLQAFYNWPRQWKCLSLTMTPQLNWLVLLITRLSGLQLVRP